MADDKQNDDKQAETQAEGTHEAPAKPAEKQVERGPAKTARAAADGTCSFAKCKQAARAKGYCRKHYMGWRRGMLGEHHRYKICSKEGCRKPRALGGLCEEHAGKGAKAAEGGAAPAA
jgi:hypothetical protein